MSLIVTKILNHGYNELTNLEHKEQKMMMDIGIQKMFAGETLTFHTIDKEAAYLLLQGEVIFQWDSNKEHALRTSVFDEKASVLHVPHSTEVRITSLTDAELLIQQTMNPNAFPSHFYVPDEIGEEIFADGLWGGTANRLVRKIFDYFNAPYSNMVMGETINLPGKWSSYIPHRHDQPEVYYYRFNAAHGFGAGFVDDDAYKLEHNSALCIPGGSIHPQASAPGYAMYFCWMIRHLEGNPWTTRNDDERYLWLTDPNVKIWPEKYFFRPANI